MQNQQQDSFPNFNRAHKKKKSIKSLKHTNNLCKEYFFLFKKQKYSDICIISSDEARFHAHKILLSAGSDFFMTMFGGALMESKAAEIHIPKVNGDILKHILEFIYTGGIELHSETVEDILSAANFFQIKALIEECYNFMGEELDSSNCLGIACFADQHDLTELHVKAIKFVCSHFEQVSNGDEFLELNADQIENIVGSENPFATSEETVFLSLIKWMEHDKLNREKYAFKLFSHVRYWLLSSNFIKQHRGKLPKEVQILDLVCDWLQWHLSPDRWGLESREFSKDKLVVITKDKMHTFNPTLKTWTTEHLPGFPLSYEKIVETNNKLIIKTRYYLKCYDLQSKEMNDLPQLNTYRSDYGLAVLNNELYVVGGWIMDGFESVRIRSIEKFNFSLNKWLDVVPMTTPFSNFMVTVAGGLMFVISEGHNMLCFDPQSNEWTSIELGGSSIGNFGFTNVNEKLFVVGGKIGDIISKNDGSSPCNGAVHSEMRLALSDPKCTSWNNRLIICGGIDDTDNFLNLTQEYNPELKEWRNLPPIDKLDSDNYEVLIIPTYNNN